MQMKSFLFSLLIIFASIFGGCQKDKEPCIITNQIDGIEYAYWRCFDMLELQLTKNNAIEQRKTGDTIHVHIISDYQELANGEYTGYFGFNVYFATPGYGENNYLKSTIKNDTIYLEYDIKNTVFTDVIGIYKNKIGLITYRKLLETLK
jgi:hypothetical protein